MKNELARVIASIPDLTDEDRVKMEESIVVSPFKRGSFLLKENEVSKNCYFLVKGCVRQYLLKSGQEKTTAFYTEGDAIVSFSSYMSQSASTHFLVCSEDCLIAVSDMEFEARMHEKYPVLESFVRKDIAKRTGEIQDELALFMSSSPEERYLNLLKKKPGLLNRVPQHQLASYIGVTPESFSRIRKRVLLSRN